MDKFLFNPFQEVSFKDCTKQIVKGSYDAVLIAPVFYNEAIEFFKKCKNINLPYVTFNTFIKESDCLCHIGQDLIQSGETAASLFYKTTLNSDELLILHIDENINNAMHMQEKENGFIRFYKDLGFDDSKIRVLKVDYTQGIEDALMKTVEKSGNTKGIFVSTSKVHYVADIIKKNDLNIKLIGYDLIEENVAHLLEDNINFLIYQNPGFQTNQGISLLMDHLVFKRELPKQRLLPIEIIIKENYRNYISSDS